MKEKVVSSLLLIVFKIFALLPIKENLIIFESQYGGKFDDNPKAIYDYFKNKNSDKYILFWSINYRNRKIVKNREVKVLYRFSIRWLYYMARAKYWIVNSRMPKWLPKRKGTNYVQTWHGTPLKKLALDMDTISMPGNSLEAYKESFLNETKKWDYLIAPNQYSKDIFKSCFAFNKTFIDSGYPRNDVLFQKNNIKDINEIKKKLGLPLDKKVILYAPTWRDDYYISRGKYRFKIPFDLKKVSEIIGDEAVIIFRAHYLVAESLNNLEEENKFYNFSIKEDISDLYLVSDMMITDYSSVFFDYANLNRPMLFFAYDYENYRDNLRGFYFDIEKESPGPFIIREEDFYFYLKEYLEKSDFVNYRHRLKKFHETYCSWEDGTASQKSLREIGILS